MPWHMSELSTVHTSAPFGTPFIPSAAVIVHSILYSTQHMRCRKRVCTQLCEQSVVSMKDNTLVSLSQLLSQRVYTFPSALQRSV
jgi:hypothetical protein